MAEDGLPMGFVVALGGHPRLQREPGSEGRYEIQSHLQAVASIIQNRLWPYTAMKTMRVLNS